MPLHPATAGLQEVMVLYTGYLTPSDAETIHVRAARFGPAACRARSRYFQLLVPQPEGAVVNTQLLHEPDADKQEYVLAAHVKSKTRRSQGERHRDRRSRFHFRPVLRYSRPGRLERDVRQHHIFPQQHRRAGRRRIVRRPAETAGTPPHARARRGANPNVRRTANGRGTAGGAGRAKGACRCRRTP